VDLQRQVLNLQIGVESKKAAGTLDTDEQLKREIILLTVVKRHLDDKSAEVRAQGIAMVLGQAQSIVDVAKMRYQDLQSEVKDLKTQMVDVSARLRQYNLLLNQMQELRERLGAIQEKLDSRHVAPAPATRPGKN